MADRPTADDVQKAFEKQIAELRDEVAVLTRALSRRGGVAYDEVRHRASDVYDEASREAGKAVRRVQHQAHVVSDAVRENPGTAATLLTAVGVLGFLIGFVAGQSSGDDRR